MAILYFSFRGSFDVDIEFYLTFHCLLLVNEEFVFFFWISNSFIIVVFWKINFCWCSESDEMMRLMKVKIDMVNEMI